MFLHDIANIVTSLHFYALTLQDGSAKNGAQLSEDIGVLVGILVDETNAQRNLLSMESGTYVPEFKPISLFDVFSQLKKQFTFLGTDKIERIRFPESLDDPYLVVSQPLLHRVLENMLKNALEATPAASVVRLFCDEDRDSITFHVWNEGTIPDIVIPHIFQRYYTTKIGIGHGLGTYSMKLIGEKYLQGKIRFTTSPDQGTVFSLSLPRQPVRPV
jgi:signal transduction histidine kinase